MTQAEFDARQNRIEANWAAVNGNIAEVERHRWRLFRNARLISESKALMAENERLLRRFWLAP